MTEKKNEGKTHKTSEFSFLFSFLYGPNPLNEKKLQVNFRKQKTREELKWNYHKNCVKYVKMSTTKTILTNSPKLPNRMAQDKREIEKYLKVFCSKAAQVIVQSRLGEKIQTFSNPRSLSNDWVSGQCSHIFIVFILYSIYFTFSVSHICVCCQKNYGFLIFVS